MPGPSVADFRDVSDGERLRSQGLFVAEGRLIVRRVIESARYTVRAVLVNEAARRDLRDALATLSSDVPIFEGDAAQFAGVTGIDFHRGCLALVIQTIDWLIVDICRAHGRAWDSEDLRLPASWFQRKLPPRFRWNHSRRPRPLDLVART